MMDRRQWLTLALAAGAACGLRSRIALGNSRPPLLSRPIPSSGEKIPVIGLGSSATFRSVAEGADVARLAAVLQTLVDGGGSVFDTAPSYGASEEVAGRLVQELGLARRLFWATKVNVAPRGGGAAERGIAVMVYIPFGRTRLFRRVGEAPLPAWTAEFDAASWAQFFIKFALGHPAVTVVTPATSKATNMADNLGGGRGRVPDARERRRMAEFVDALPAA